MKINFVRFIIGFALSILISYGFYAFWNVTTKGSDMHFAVVVSSFVYSLFCISNTLSMVYNSKRTTILIRTVSAIFFAVGLGVLILFSIYSSNLPAFIISIGVLFLIYLLIVYSLKKSNQ